MCALIKKKKDKWRDYFRNTTFVWLSHKDVFLYQNKMFRPPLDVEINVCERREKSKILKIYIRKLILLK